MKTIQSPDRSALPPIELAEPRRQIVLSGPSSCLSISEIDEEEAAEWDRIVRDRGGIC